MEKKYATMPAIAVAFTVGAAALLNPSSASASPHDAFHGVRTQTAQTDAASSAYAYQAEAKPVAKNKTAKRTRTKISSRSRVKNNAHVEASRLAPTTFPVTPEGVKLQVTQRGETTFTVVTDNIPAGKDPAHINSTAGKPTKIDNGKITNGSVRSGSYKGIVTGTLGDPNFHWNVKVTSKNMSALEFAELNARKALHDVMRALVGNETVNPAAASLQPATVAAQPASQPAPSGHTVNTQSFKKPAIAQAAASSGFSQSFTHGDITKFPVGSLTMDNNSKERITLEKISHPFLNPATDSIVSAKGDKLDAKVPNAAKGSALPTPPQFLTNLDSIDSPLNSLIDLIGASLIAIPLYAARRSWRYIALKHEHRFLEDVVAASKQAERDLIPVERDLIPTELDTSADAWKRYIEKTRAVSDTTITAEEPVVISKERVSEYAPKEIRKTSLSNASGATTIAASAPLMDYPTGPETYGVRSRVAATAEQMLDIPNFLRHQPAEGNVVPLVTQPVKSARKIPTTDETMNALLTTIHNVLVEDEDRIVPLDLTGQPETKNKMANSLPLRDADVVGKFAIKGLENALFSADEPKNNTARRTSAKPTRIIATVAERPIGWRPDAQAGWWNDEPKRRAYLPKLSARLRAASFSLFSL